jgi:hypothetical protein
VMLNSAHGEVYSIQYYVIMFVSDLLQIDGFTVHFDTTEILLKVALNIITITHININPNNNVSGDMH